MNGRFETILRYADMSWMALTNLFSNTMAYVSYHYSQLSQLQINQAKIQKEQDEYLHWQKIIGNLPLPAVFVDLDAFYSNLDTLLQLVRDANESKEDKAKVRLATKSLRSPELIRMVLKHGRDLITGVMCYSVSEAYFLWKQGIVDDILIAYPTVRSSDLELLLIMHRNKVKVRLVVDSIEQIKLISQAMEGVDSPFLLIIELDTSIRFLNGAIHLGARRSPIYSLKDLQELIKKAKTLPWVKIDGVMAYEALVAGVPDANRHNNFIWNKILSLVRHASKIHTAKLRTGVPDIFKQEDLSLNIFNIGGTGSINFAINESIPMELTFGSGVLMSTIFKGFSNLEKLKLQHSIFFATFVSRTSENGKYITAFKGGPTASGPIGEDRFPEPISPAGLVFLKDEGNGEVQIPFRVTRGKAPGPGKPLIFVPAKTGELAEHFNEYYVGYFSKQTFFKPSPKKVQQPIVEIPLEKVKTYRGYGQQF